MIPALAKAMDSLFSPGEFGLSWKSRGQQSYRSMYACAISIKLVSTLRQTSLLRNVPHNAYKFFPPTLHNTCWVFV